MNASIHGDGVAAACCAHLLRAAGLDVGWQRLDRPRVPVILLSGAALTLLGDVFGPLYPLADAHRIRRRVVLWGRSSEPVEAEHPAVVSSESFLLNCLPETIQDAKQELDREWRILTAPPLPGGSRQEVFGNRIAAAVKVDLLDRADSDACWTESVDGGWLFLMPTNATSGFLLAVGGSPEELLASSRLLRDRIQLTGERAGSFPTHPRMYWPLAGPGWLACGSAAMAFDPICGDGTAQAVREAILASAVVQAAAKGAALEPLLAHYQSRLAAGMARHLLLCAEFYRSGGEGTWWSTQHHRTTEGAQRCSEKVQQRSGFRYRMQGFELQPVP